MMNKNWVYVLKIVYIHQSRASFIHNDSVPSVSAADWDSLMEFWWDILLVGWRSNHPFASLIAMLVQYERQKIGRKTCHHDDFNLCVKFQVDNKDIWRSCWHNSLCIKSKCLLGVKLQHVSSFFLQKYEKFLSFIWIFCEWIFNAPINLKGEYDVNLPYTCLHLSTGHKFCIKRPWNVWGIIGVIIAACRPSIPPRFIGSL